MSKSKQPIKEMPKQSVEQTPNMEQLMSTDLKSLRSIVTCKVCFKYLYEPYTISCGHTFCYSCLCTWFEARHVRKTCPTCRAKICHTPAPCYLVKDIVNIFVSQEHLTPSDETAEEHGKLQAEEAAIVERDKANKDPRNGGLFRGSFRIGPGLLHTIRDPEDGVERCPLCNWEIEDNRCARCEVMFDQDGLEQPAYNGSYTDYGSPGYDEEPSDLDGDVGWDLYGYGTPRQGDPTGTFALDDTNPDLPARILAARERFRQARSEDEDDEYPGPSYDLDDEDDDDGSSLGDFVVNTSDDLDSADPPSWEEERSMAGTTNSSSYYETPRPSRGQSVEDTEMRSSDDDHNDSDNDDDSDEGGAISNGQRRRPIAQPRRGTMANRGTSVGTSTVRPIGRHRVITLDDDDDDESDPDNPPYRPSSDISPSSRRISEDTRSSATVDNDNDDDVDEDDADEEPISRHRTGGTTATGRQRKRARYSITPTMELSSPEPRPTRGIRPSRGGFQPRRSSTLTLGRNDANRRTIRGSTSPSVTETDAEPRPQTGLSGLSASDAISIDSHTPLDLDDSDESIQSRRRLRRNGRARGGQDSGRALPVVNGRSSGPSGIPARHRQSTARVPSWMVSSHARVGSSVGLAPSSRMRASRNQLTETTPIRSFDGPARHLGRSNVDSSPGVPGFGPSLPPRTQPNFNLPPFRLSAASPSADSFSYW
ncbi:MAG: hypothetical protein M1823_003482 [Watsoniomyces obsoletus]|nr:MAG: hypothetical protein M1823_003482 [Watsoniomyces obsoletus]